MLKTLSVTVGAGSTVWGFLIIVLLWLPYFTALSLGCTLGLGENQLPPKSDMLQAFCFLSINSHFPASAQLQDATFTNLKS